MRNFVKDKSKLDAAMQRLFRFINRGPKLSQKNRRRVKHWCREHTKLNCRIFGLEVVVEDGRRLLRTKEAT